MSAVGGHVVVTGVAGFIGSHLAEALVDRGHEVVGIDCFTPAYPPAEKRRNLERLLGHPGFRLVEGDLVTLALDAWLEGAAVVFHQAAQPGVRSSWGRDFAIYVHHNILATQCLLEACTRTGVPRLVAASSSSVYGDAPVYPTTEESITRPVSPYGVTKLASEHLCLAYARPGVSDVSVATLRYFTVYGPRQRPDMAFTPMLEGLATNGSFRLYGDGSVSRSFTYVRDAVGGTIAAMERGIPGTSYNIGGGDEATMAEAIALAEQIAERTLVVERHGEAAGDVRRTRADVTRAERELEWRPTTTLADGLRAQWDWVAARVAAP